jgi:hypothetical protein
MKTYKKIIFGLCLLISLTVGSLFTFSHKAAALTQNDFKQPPATYNLVSTSSISATLGGNVAVTFDNNSTNPTAKNLIFTPDSTSFVGGKFCAGSQITMPNQTAPVRQPRLMLNGLTQDRTEAVTTIPHSWARNLTRGK